MKKRKLFILGLCVTTLAGCSPMMGKAKDIVSDLMEINPIELVSSVFQNAVGVVEDLIGIDLPFNDSSDTNTTSNTNTDTSDTGGSDTNTGTIDGGSTDTGSTDTGSTDTGSTDTGSTDTGSTEVVPVGTYGSLENPLSVADAIAKVKEIVGSNGESNKTVAIDKLAYVKGVVASQPKESTKNQGQYDFLIKDNYLDKSSVEFYYGTLASGVSLTEGDEIIVYGMLADYSKGYKYEFISNDTYQSQVISAQHKTYTISKSVGENGTMSDVAQSAQNGTEIEFTVTPNTGYKVDAVKVNGATKTEEDGKYKFTLVCNTTIEVSFIDKDATISKIELTPESLLNSTGSTVAYADANGDHVVNGVTFTSNQVGYYGSGLQFKSGGSYVTTKTELPDTIKSVEFVWSSSKDAKDNENGLKFTFGTGDNTEEKFASIVADQKTGYIVEPTGQYKSLTISNVSTYAMYFEKIIINLGAPDQVTPEVVSVSLDQTSLSLVEGSDPVTLTATVVVKGLASQEVAWTSNNEEVATVNNGVVTPLKAGSATISAISRMDSTKFATCNVTVTANVVNVTGVTLDKTTLEMETGTTAQLVATVAPENATDKSVAWSSSNTEVATVDNGTITAVSSGNTIITVKTTDGNYEATCAVEVKVKKGSTLETALTVTEAIEKCVGFTSSNVTDLYFFKGTIKEITGTVYGNLILTDGTNDLTVYGCSKNGTFTYDETSGKYTKFNNAKDWATDELTKDLIPGDEITIKGRLYDYTNGGSVTHEGDGIPQTATIAKKITSISLDCSELNMTLNDQPTKLTATVLGRGGADLSVTWSSSKTDVATVSEGTVTPVAVGTTTITATSTFDATQTATCSVTVTAGTVSVTSISLNKTTLTLDTNVTEQLVATVLPTDATNKTVNWTSSNESVVTVDDGLLTTLANGQSTITAKTVDGEFEAQCVVTVSHVNTLKLAYEQIEAGTTTSCTYKGVVTGLAGSSFFVQDEDYGMYVYNSAIVPQDLSVGDIVSITSTLKKYNGCIETDKVTACSIVGEGAVPQSVEITSVEQLATIKQNVKSKVELLMPKTLPTWNSGSSANVTTTLNGEKVTLRLDKYGFDSTLSETYLASAGKLLTVDTAITSANSSNGSTTSNQFLLTQSSTLTIKEVHATSLTLTSDVEEIKVNETATLTVTSVPAVITDDVTFEITSGNEFATLDGNKLSAVAEGTVKVVAKAGQVTSNEITIVISGTSQGKVAAAEYNFSNFSDAGSDLTTNSLSKLNEKKVSGTATISSIKDLTKASMGYSGYFNLGLKFGTSSVAGGMTFVMSQNIKEVKVVIAGWTANDTFSINGLDAVKPGVEYKADDCLKEFTFTLSQETTDIQISFSKRGFLQQIVFY